MTLQGKQFARSYNPVFHRAADGAFVPVYVLLRHVGKAQNNIDQPGANTVPFRRRGSM